MPCTRWLRAGMKLTSGSPGLCRPKRDASGCTAAVVSTIATLDHQRRRASHFASHTLTTTGSAPRLLRTSPYELVDPDKVAADSSAYAILSHTWRLQRDEITYKDMSSAASLQAATTREAFTKIRLACDQARRDGLEYVWIDTCCIDKSSSADLSEAINSMYAWYALSLIHI